MSKVGQRIKSKRKALGLSQQELAGACGWERQTRISSYESGRTQPDLDDLQKIAKALKTSPSELAWGQSDEPVHHAVNESPTAYIHEKEQKDEIVFLSTQFSAWDSDTPLDEDEVEVPFFTEVEVAAGVGSMLANERIGPKLRFAKSTLKNAGVPVDAAACVRVSGDSMEPALPDGSVVGVNTADTLIRDGMMYAIEHGGLLRVKILQKLPHGSIKLRSHNSTEYPDEILPADEAVEIRIIGRVFWYSVLL